MSDNSRLRLARLAAGLSQTQLADQANGRMDRPTLDGNTISRLERGIITRPRPRVVDALCAVLGTTPAELGYDTPDPVTWAVEADRAEPAALDALASILSGLRRLEDTTSGRAVLPVVIHHGRTVDRLAGEARLALRPAALELLNEYRIYEGWLRHDVGDRSGARAAFDSGLAAAVEAGSETGTAHALSFKGYAELHSGSPLAGASLVRAANRFPHTPTERTYFHTLTARCLAAAGGIAESDAELLAADATMDRIEETGEGRTYWFGLAWFTVQRGLVHAAAGRARLAVRAIEDGLAGMPPEHRNAGWAAKYRTTLARLS